jgi:ammonium transporter, Amt family
MVMSHRGMQAFAETGGARRMTTAIGKYPQALLAAAAGLLISAGPALAATDKGDTAFLMISSVLVLLMTIPGLALFYCGLVRTKNALSMLMQIFAIVCIVCIIWMLYGYSVTFTNGGEHNSWFGGLSKVFLRGVTPESEAGTFTGGVFVPEYAYIWFQMTFAAITPALIVGAFAERMKFSALILFTILWVTFIYFPIAHMVWYWAGPDAVSQAAKAAATATGETRVVAEEHLQTVLMDAGLAFQWGAIDFAGGTVVHTNSGIAALVGALILGPRRGYGREPMPPHSLTLAMVGASLLWVGWFGFNAGSNLEANGLAALAMGNTFGATATAALGWMFTEWATKGKPTVLGITTGAVAGLVAVTPASGFAGPMGALALGLVAGVVCFVFSTAVKSALGYDDSLDVFGVHCIGGIVGALATGVLVNPELGGTGIFDYAANAGEGAVVYDMSTQMIAQAKAVGLTLAWSGIGSAVLYKIVDLVIGLRPPPEAERAGLDITEHGERAYNY